MTKVFDFINLDTREVKAIMVPGYIPVGTRIEHQDGTWERLVTAPRAMRSQWSDSAGTSTGFYSHGLGYHVANERAEERELTKLGRVKLTNQDIDTRERVRADTQAREEALIKAPLPSLTEIINN